MVRCKAQRPHEEMRCCFKSYPYPKAADGSHRARWWFLPITSSGTHITVNKPITHLNYVSPIRPQSPQYRPHLHPEGFNKTNRTPRASTKLILVSLIQRAWQHSSSAQRMTTHSAMIPRSLPFGVFQGRKVFLLSRGLLSKKEILPSAPP